MGFIGAGKSKKHRLGRSSNNRRNDILVIKNEIASAECDLKNSFGGSGMISVLMR